LIIQAILFTHLDERLFLVIIIAYPEVIKDRCKNVIFTDKLIDFALISW
jgi:hypothetical protein